MRLDPKRAAREIAASLRAVADARRAAQEKRYLKSELKHLGVGIPALRRIAKRFARQHAELTRVQLLALVAALWESPVHERRVAAAELLSLFGPLLEAEDIALLERLIREAKTWALVDGLAAGIAGGLVERVPELGKVLDRWAVDEDFWVRRSALLALLPGLRRGEGDFERFGRYADAMLEEREFFIRKAIGWVLRETSKERPDLVYRWLQPRSARASGVTIREAIKYLSETQRATILAARK